MLSKPLNNGDFCAIHSTAVQTDNLSSKLLMNTHQMYHPASRTSFSDTMTITSCRKTAVVLKLSKVIFAEFFTLTAKI